MKTVHKHVICWQTIFNRPPVRALTTSTQLKGTEVHQTGKDEISLSLPKKIPRDKTSILKALSKTVKPTWEHPSRLFMDDLNLLPSGSFEKMSMLYARAAGRKAAQHVITSERAAWNFTRNPVYDPSEQHPQAYLAANKQLLKDAATVEGLEERIDKENVPAAIESYKAIKEQQESAEKGNIVSIQHVPLDVSECDILSAMACAQHCRIHTDKFNRNSSRTAYVRFASSDEARAAAEAQQLHLEDGQTLNLAHQPDGWAEMIGDDIKLDLLGLLCFSAGQEITEEKWYAEEIYAQDTEPTPRQRTEIDADTASLIEELFREIDHDPWAWTLMIKGKIRNCDVEGAFELYYEMQQKHIPVPLDVFNSLMSANADNQSDMWNARMLKRRLVKILEDDMPKAGVRPDQKTFSSLLTIPDPYMNKHIFNEMNALGIEPSLCSYVGVLTPLMRRKPGEKEVDQAAKDAVQSVLDHAQGRHFSPVHNKDLKAFRTLMTMCYQLKSPQMAHKVMAMVEYGHNRTLLPFSQTSPFSTQFFFCLLENEQSLDQVMPWYEKLSPWSLPPTMKILDNILDRIIKEDGEKYLPRIWADLFALKDINQRPHMIDKILQCLSARKQESWIEQQSLQIVDKVFEKMYHARIERQKWLRKKEDPYLVLTGKQLGMMAEICLLADDFHKAWQFFDLYVNDTQNRQYFNQEYPRLASYEKLCDACIVEQDAEKAVDVLEQACKSFHHEEKTIISRIESLPEQLDLSEALRERLEAAKNAIGDSHESHTWRKEHRARDRKGKGQKRRHKHTDHQPQS